MLTLVTFVSIGSLVLLVSMLVGGRKTRAEARVHDLTGEIPSGTYSSSMAGFAQATLPKIAGPLLPGSDAIRSRLRTRLIHAGFYGRHAMSLFLGAKMVLLVLPLVLGLVAGLTQYVTLLHGILFGLVGGAVGLIGPGMWLDWRKKKRVTTFRRALPDALDVIVICLEGGLSLQGAFQRVGSSLRSAHPLLSSEMSIIQREIQMGRSTGEAMRQFADRCDLEEVRSLASVVLQAERLGASIVKSLRVHADTLRIKRLQRAEELAHMAGTKMVFPTLLCIFPAILFVVAGPAAFHILDLFASMK